MSLETSLEPRQPPTEEEIAQGLREFIEEEDVHQWHFPMMNDQVRNSAYDRALGAAIQKKKAPLVLDIGTGSGLLAMMAARQGAARVITCEAIPRIARKARQIIARNGFSDRIEVMNRLSTDLEVGMSFPERADILVTEIFDDGLLGEGAFVAYEHALAHLLKPDAQIIPQGVRVFASCLESREIFENHRVEQAAGFDVSLFNEFTMTEYKGYHLDKVKHRLLSAPQQIFEFDFRHRPKDAAIPLEFKVTESGDAHGIVFWYELQLDADTVIRTGPGLARLSSWKQAVLLLDDTRHLTRGETFRVTAHHNSDEIWFTV